MTEYGSTMADRPGNYDPGFGLLPETPDQKGSTLPYAWRYPWRTGEVIWCGFDHGRIASIEFGAMGFVDYFRLPKRQYHWYRNAYRGIEPPAWPGPGTPAQLQLARARRRSAARRGSTMRTSSSPCRTRPAAR